MSGALDITLTRNGARLAARIVPPPAVPVAGLMLGRAPEEVAALLPRIFNLCGQAQGLAARLAMGLEGGASDARREILRDHLAQLCLHWPQALGLAPRALPEDWAEGGAALEHWLWGGDRPGDLAGWLASGRGVAPVLAAITAAFGPGEAVADLPPLQDPMALNAQENSPAGRVADDPLMQAAAATFGRGPLWRALGRGLDLARLCHEAPMATQLAPGVAVVEAARGSYALSVNVEAGRVTALTRVTPTDHLIAPGGALERAFASLPATKSGRAALLLAILDPCVPVHLREAENA